MIKKRLIQLLGDAKKHVLSQILWNVIALLAQIAVAYAAAVMLSDLFEQGTIAYLYLIIVVTAVIVKYYCDRKIVDAAYLASADVKLILRRTIYEKLLRLGLGYRQSVKTATLAQMAVEGVEQLEIYFGKYLSQFFYALLAPLLLFILLSFVNLRASVVLLVCVPLIPIVIMAVMKIAKKLLEKYFSIYYGLADSFLENLQGMTTLKIYQADMLKARQMDRESEEFRRVTMKVLSMQLNSTIVMDIVALGGAAAGIVVGLAEFYQGNVDLKGALLIILLASEFFIPMRLLGSFFHIGMNGMKASDHIFTFLDLPEPMKKDKEINAQEISITVRDLHFNYDETREILRGLNFTLQEGSFTSIVGASGCGKSTLADILIGHHQSYSGKVFVNSDELSEIDESSLMRHVTIVRHNAYIFSGTIRDNLLIADPTASDEEMVAVLKQVQLMEFLYAQHGLDTILEENGSNLSGGQRQRLAIARSLLHDTPIYIFDEATSNIDMESEESIMQVIHTIAKTKTVVLISHRLANVVASDQILMMQNGLIVEKGTHHQLMAMKGTYCNLYSQQMELENYSANITAEEKIA